MQAGGKCQVKVSFLPLPLSTCPGPCRLSHKPISINSVKPKRRFLSAVLQIPYYHMYEAQCLRKTDA